VGVSGIRTADRPRVKSSNNPGFLNPRRSWSENYESGTDIIRKTRIVKSDANFGRLNEPRLFSARFEFSRR